MQASHTLINFIPPIAHTYAPPIANALLTYLIKSCCSTVEPPDEIPSSHDKHTHTHMQGHTSLSIMQIIWKALSLEVDVKARVGEQMAAGDRCWALSSLKVGFSGWPCMIQQHATRKKVVCDERMIASNFNISFKKFPLSAPVGLVRTIEPHS